MNWLKWILAYLFDCVNAHTTWPHRDRAGFAYVCCLDCGRELPYWLQRMSIVTTVEQLADPGLVQEESPSNFEEPFAGNAMGYLPTRLGIRSSFPCGV